MVFSSSPWLQTRGREMRGRKPVPKGDGNTDTIARSPRAPSCLGEVGKAEWRKVAPALARGGLLTEESRSLLTRYCEAIEGAEDCAEILRKGSRITETKSGPKAHPAVRQQLQYQQMALRLAESLGITATAQQRAANKKAPLHASTGIFDEP